MGTLIPKNFWKDYVWWYKKQAPVYGRFASLWYSGFNALYFQRDGNWRKKSYEA